MRNFKLEKDLEANLLVSGRGSFSPKPPDPSVPLGLHTAHSTPGCEGKLRVPATQKPYNVFMHSILAENYVFRF